MRVIIAAARTGGHINPGIAIANKIKQEQKDSEILFIGTTEGLENDLVPRAGFKLETIEAYGFNRKITIENIRKIIKTIKSKKNVKKILEEFKPDIVIGTGGYICMPVIMAAHSLKIPTVLHESNAFPGATVKVLSSTVNEICVGFGDAKKRLPKAKKVVVTGTPTKIRDLQLGMEKKNSLKKQLGFIEHLPLVLVFGGSQGAKSINDSVLELITKGKNKNYQIIWAAGKTQYEQICKSLSNNMNIEGTKQVKILPYIYNMEEMMNICDIVVSRSGAMTITEVAKVGKAGIFIPLPFATENHQEYNAKVLADIGAAKIILDKELTADRLSKEIEYILQENGMLESMGKKAKKMEIKEVEDKIYQEIIKIVE